MKCLLSYAIYLSELGIPRAGSMTNASRTQKSTWKDDLDLVSTRQLSTCRCPWRWDLLKFFKGWGERMFQVVPLNSGSILE